MTSRKIYVLEKNKKNEIAEILNIFFNLLSLIKKKPAKHNTHHVLGYKKMMTIFERIKNIKKMIIKKKANLSNYLFTCSIFVK